MDIAGAEAEVERPKVFFREDGPTAKAAVLRIVRPAILPTLSDAEFAKRVAAEVAAQEAAIRDDFAQKQRRFLGGRAVLRQFPFDRPRSKEPRCELSPRVAAKDKESRIGALRRKRPTNRGWSKIGEWA